MRGRLLVAGLLLAVGAAMILRLQGIDLFPGGFAVWWPSVIVLWGLACLLTGRLFRAGVWMALGGVLQYWRLGALPIPWDYAAPTALIVLGLLVLVGVFARRRGHHAGWREA